MTEHHHLHRPTRFRPAKPPSLFTALGPMPFLLALAAIVTLLAAVSSSRLFDSAAASAEKDAEMDRQARSELLTLGWAPRGELVPGVERLVAERPFHVQLAHGTVEGRVPSNAKLARAEAVLTRELARYPAGFLARVHLRRVLFCEDLEEAKKPIPSLPNHAATLLVDVDAGEAFLSRLVHHEVFHFLDFADDRLVTRDPDWERLNVPDFRYEGGGRTVREPSATDPDGGPPGFVTRYATAALEEDKAELFSWLMSDPALVAARAGADAVLRAKVFRLDALVTKFVPRPYVWLLPAADAPLGK
jgi:hypothetical protein